MVFFGGTGDGGGMKFVILRRGSLIFEGPKGGFLSVTVFCPVCFRDESCVEAVEKALVSCFSLVFLSSANWFSRSRTC